MNRLILVCVLGIAVLGSTPNSHAEFLIYTAYLSAPDGIASPGTGFASVGYDPVANTLAVTALFGNLVGTTTAAHIHAPTAVPGVEPAGIAVPLPTILLGVTSGVDAEVFDMTSTDTYSTAFLNANGGTAAGAEAALATSLAAGTAYLNIHTSFAGGGEIRGFLTRTVPEPSAFLLWGMGGLVGLIAYRGRRRWK